MLVFAVCLCSFGVGVLKILLCRGKEDIQGDDTEEAAEDEPQHCEPPAQNHRLILSFADPPTQAPGWRPAASSKRKRHWPDPDEDHVPVYPRMIRQQIIEDARRADDEEFGDDLDVDTFAEDTTERPPLLHARTSKASTSLGVDHRNHCHQSRARSGLPKEDEPLRKAIRAWVLQDLLADSATTLSALVMWQSEQPKIYCLDPALALFVALLVAHRASSLLQNSFGQLMGATPEHVSVEEVRDDIETIPGVRFCQNVHVWALSSTRLVASLGVELDFGFCQENRERWMELSKDIKSCLRGHGVHSSTIQPSFSESEFPAGETSLLETDQCSCRT